MLTIWTGGNLECRRGLILPSSLVGSNSGEKSSGGQLLPVSWQSLHHDEGLLDDSIEPSIVAIIDAPQLAERPGNLVEAIDAIRRRFPTSLIWTPESVGLTIVPYSLGWV